jgi:hypothetical protein
MDPAAGVRRAIRLGVLHDYHGRRTGGRRRDSGSAERFRASGKDVDFLPANKASREIMSLACRGEIIRRVLSGERGVDVARKMGIHYRGVRHALQASIPYLDCALNSKEMEIILSEYNDINRYSKPVESLEVQTALFLSSSLSFLTESNRALIESLQKGKMSPAEQIKACEVLGRNLVSALDVLHKNTKPESGPLPAEPHHSDGF